MDESIISFGLYADVESSARSWLAAFCTSSAIYAALAVVAFGSAAKKIVVEKSVDATFVEKVAKEAPPPVAAAKAEPPPAAAPVVRPDQKIRKLDKPPPRKELVAPKEMPKQAPQEADPSQDKGVAVYGDAGNGDPAGLEGGMQGGVAGGTVGAIAVPEDAVPPLPLKSNTPPPYPQEARAAGKTGMVILKVIILADGHVADVQVMRGDEPFVGLLATVLGIISTFQGIAATGSGGLSSVSAGIRGALVETALGLSVAIPAVLAFNYLLAHTVHDEMVLNGAAGELLDALEDWAEGAAQASGQVTVYRSGAAAGHSRSVAALQPAVERAPQAEVPA